LDGLLGSFGVVFDGGAFAATAEIATQALRPGS
jgi:hypothetical protein